MCVVLKCDGVFQDVTASMDEGLAKVNYVCDQAEKILPNTSVEGKKLIEQQVTELTNDWVRHLPHKTHFVKLFKVKPIQLY
jgi:hypothetical protein